MHPNNLHLELAKILSDQFSHLPQVIAVALSGSVSGARHDPDSDIDLYVITTSPVPLETRQAIVANRGASRADLGLDFWDPGDEWFDAPTGIEVDIMYWDQIWIEDRIDQVLTHYQASMGYSTCTWHTIQNAVSLFDRNGWLGALQEKSRQPYPQPLQQAIIRKNYPVLRDIIPAYLHQIEKAVQRQDLVSINHRVAAMLASYFDILYAVNRAPHPGEKQLLAITPNRCPVLPEGMILQVETVLSLAASANPALITAINDLIDRLDEILAGDFV